MKFYSFTDPQKMISLLRFQQSQRKSSFTNVKYKILRRNSYKFHIIITGEYFNKNIRQPLGHKKRS